MFDPETADSIETLNRFHGRLTSLRKFDDLMIDPVWRGQLALSQPEECRIITYRRVQRNVDSMTALNHVDHFQALSMFARSIFELSIDIRLMQSVPDAAERMVCFQKLESLRAAKAAVARSKEPNGFPASRTVSNIETSCKASIEARAAQIWGDKFSKVRHWSHLDLKQRVSRIADDGITHMYVYTYRTMSWQTHPGLQGSYGLPASAFPTIAKSALNLAVFSYAEVMRSLTKTLALEKHDPQIDAKLILALMLPYTDVPADELKLRRDLDL